MSASDSSPKTGTHAAEAGLQLVAASLERL